MNDAKIQRLIKGARVNTARATRCLNRGDKESARKYTERANTCLSLVHQASTLSAVSQFVR